VPDHSDPVPRSDVAVVRAKLMEDLATVEVTAEALGKSPRTIQRMIAEKKIPTVTVGRTPYVVVSGARAAFMSSTRTGHEPPKRGRPAGRKAA
jgi:hypothetical protein